MLLLVPSDEQQPYARKRWQGRLPQLKFSARTFPPNPPAWDVKETAAGALQFDALVLDFVGHKHGVADALRKELREKAQSGCWPTVVDVAEVMLRQAAAAIF